VNVVRRYLRTICRLCLGAPSEKRLVKYSIARRIAWNRGGIYLPEDHLVWHQDEEFFRIYSGMVDVCEPSMDRKYLVYQMAQALGHIEGETVECGCYEGVSSYFICKGRNRIFGHHIFDSFQGLSLPIAEDRPNKKTAQEWEGGDLSTSHAIAEERLREFENVHFYPGWIPDRFGEVSKLEFAFVHIDVDLYEPTRDSVEFFYPRLVSGGVIICDDYGFATCPGAKKACDEYMSKRPENIIHLPTGQGLIIKA